MKNSLRRRGSLLGEEARGDKADGRTERQAELDHIQAEVNAAVEDLYGVSGLGPFNEF